MATYKIVRFFQNDSDGRKTIETGLTLEEAQAHCEDRESSSRTCAKASGLARTAAHGPWFDGYTEE